jgi:dihydropteroate synthase
LADTGHSFALVEVLIRRPDRIEIALDAVTEVRAWSERLPPHLGARLGELMGRIAHRERHALAPSGGGAHPLIMGALNVTPDSFSDGGDFAEPGAAIARGRAMIGEGAAIVDIGGESTRPGAEPVAPEQEMRRVLPVVEGLAGAGVPLSIDTRNAATMRRAIAAGVAIVNDVSALGHDPAAIEAVADSGVAVVLMHARGDPRTMQLDPAYAFAPLDVFDYLEERVAACLAAGIGRERIVVDPGIGFGKTLAHNLEIMHRLALLHGLGCPILVGASRKSFIGRLSRSEVPKERGPGSLAAALAAVAEGARIVRVHDVAATAQALAVSRAITEGAP